ncbi:MAG: potassium-transporting ATPase subunit KdpC [bacterium]
MNIKSELITSIKVFMGFSILLGIIYPLTITCIAQITMPEKANGSLIKEKGVIIGSSLIGQKFDKPQYFNSRPSAVDYNAAGSGGSNLGPTSKKLITTVEERIKVIQKDNNLNKTKKIPADMVLTSASGIDPHISIENATIQIHRISKVRGISESKIKELINKNMDSDFIGIWGQSGVNVLKLNLDLDKISGK